MMPTMIKTQSTLSPSRTILNLFKIFPCTLKRLNTFSLIRKNPMSRPPSKQTRMERRSPSWKTLWTHCPTSESNCGLHFVPVSLTFDTGLSSTVSNLLTHLGLYNHRGRDMSQQHHPVSSLVDGSHPLRSHLKTKGAPHWMQQSENLSLVNW